LLDNLQAYPTLPDMVEACATLLFEGVMGSTIAVTCRTEGWYGL